MHNGTEQGFCCINREKVTIGANALYVNVYFAAYVLYMRVNSHVICKMNPRFDAVVENDMTLCPIESEVQFTFCVRLFARIRRLRFFIVQL